VFAIGPDTEISVNFGKTPFTLKPVDGSLGPVKKKDKGKKPGVLGISFWKATRYPNGNGGRRQREAEGREAEGRQKGGRQKGSRREGGRREVEERQTGGRRETEGSLKGGRREAEGRQREAEGGRRET
jgi:hypothetical protein